MSACDLNLPNLQVRKYYALLLLICLAHCAHAESIWIDTDVSIGSPIREVDDAFALVLALHSPEVRIAGLSTTYGNARLRHTTRAARDLIARFGQSAGPTVDSVFTGARSPSDLGRRSEASEALARILQKQRITYIGLGPLTNLATVLQRHPRLANQIERVIFVGGAAPHSRLTLGSFHIHDANVIKDPAAVEVVLRSNLPITLIPIATSAHLRIEQADLRQLEENEGAGNYLARRSKTWLWFWTHLAKTDGGPIFDALPLVLPTNPELLYIKRRYANMDQARNLVVRPYLTNGRPVLYCTGFATGTKSFVMQRLLLKPIRK